jgi:hypothetical protein
MSGQSWDTRLPGGPVLGQGGTTEPREAGGGPGGPPGPSRGSRGPAAGTTGQWEELGIQARIDSLTAWWLRIASEETEAVVSKAIEYGATDLLDLGREIARINGWTMTDAECAEAGVYVYLRGKVSRWTAALTEGRPVSDDTLHDIGVYVRMAQRIREVGGWPG